MAYELTRQQRYEDYVNKINLKYTGLGLSKHERKKTILKRPPAKLKAFELAVFEENTLPVLETPLYKRKKFTEI